MNKKAVFCTSYVKSNPGRYQDWINYYTEYFVDKDIDLWMFNDGPYEECLDLKGVQIRDHEKRLGRETVWIFPGWKRSFYTALRTLVPLYTHIGHIESDCWIVPKAKEEFLFYLVQEGYFTAWTPTYNFPEGSIQVLNNIGSRQYFMDKYSCEENWYENIDFEKDLERLNPTLILDGDRVEKQFQRFNKRYTYVSGMSYEEYVRLYAD